MESAATFIDEKIRQLWRLAREDAQRECAKFHSTEPEIVEEWKWVKPKSGGTPVFSHGGMVCTGETYKNVVKMTFAKALR